MKHIKITSAREYAVSLFFCLGPILLVTDSVGEEFENQIANRVWNFTVISTRRVALVYADAVKQNVIISPR